MKYYMPTTIYDGEDIVLKSESKFKSLGKKALIVTGKSSAKKSGALDDVVKVLHNCDIEYKIFDEVRENPPIYQNLDGARVGEGSDFVIAIGGGSPMDTAKGIAILLKHGTDNYVEKLFGKVNYDALPVVAIPTTAGTGSEVTPYAVFTDDEKQTKLSMPRRVFPIYSFIDVKYFMTAPQNVKISTIVDAFSHAVESYNNVRSTPYSELYALKAIELFGKHRELLLEDDICEDVFEDFVRASTFAGIAIAQAGTSLPHALGYPITYHFGVPHGIANGMFMVEYFKLSLEDKVADILRAANFKNLDDFSEYMNSLISRIVGKLDVKEDDIVKYTDMLFENTAKLKSHPREVSYEDIVNVYKNTLRLVSK